VTALVDTSVLIDYLRGDRATARILETERASAPLHASEITRLEVLAGMRPTAATAPRRLLGTLTWHPSRPRWPSAPAISPSPRPRT
jgi:predicted nucleic acid-binding protein